jgi:hypothetical protein
MPSWENMSVTITNTWGDGGRINFDNAPIQRPRFRLRGVYLPRPKACPALCHYAIEFNPGYMVDWWSGMQMFPLGGDPPRIGSPLPPLDSSAAALDLYGKALAPIRAELNKTSNTLARLEGYMSVIYPDVPRVDRVQMTYLPGAVLNEAGPNGDLVYVHFSFADANGAFVPNEDGGGTGPPH